MVNNIRRFFTPDHSCRAQLNRRGVLVVVAVHAAVALPLYHLAWVFLDVPLPVLWVIATAAAVLGAIVSAHLGNALLRRPAWVR